MTIQTRLTSDMLTGNVIVRRVVHGILAASALAALSVSAPALAQQAPAPADQELKEIVVTVRYCAGSTLNPLRRSRS